MTLPFVCIWGNASRWPIVREVSNSLSVEISVIIRSRLDIRSSAQLPPRRGVSRLFSLRVRSGEVWRHREALASSCAGPARAVVSVSRVTGVRGIVRYIPGPRYDTEEPPREVSVLGGIIILGGIFNLSPCQALAGSYACQSGGLTAVLSYAREGAVCALALVLWP